MFSRLFASAVDALVPQIKSNLELIQYNWEDILNFLNSLNQSDLKVNIQETNIRQYLNAILRLIKDDIKTDKASNGQCIDYILHEKVLIILTEYSLKNIPKGLLIEVVNLFTELINLFPSKILPQLSCRKPMIKLILHNLNSPNNDNAIKEAYISLILTIVNSLNLHPALLPLFTAKPNRRARRPSSISCFVNVNINQYTIKTENLAPIMIFLVCLQNHLCTPGALGVHSRSALFELISLMSNHNDALPLLINEPIFKELMLEQLSFQYSSMPTSFSRRKFIRPDKRLSASATSQRLKQKFENNSIKERNITLIDTFFELWKFVNNIMTTTNNSIKEYVLTGVIIPCLNEIALPGFYHNTHSIVCSHTMYFLDMLSESTSPEIFETLIEFICITANPKIQNEESLDNKSILHYMLNKVEDFDDEISLVAMQLFDTLLSLNYPKVNETLGLVQTSKKKTLSNVEIYLKVPESYFNLSLPSQTVNPILREFLVLLNPIQSGLDDYFLDCIGLYNLNYSHSLKNNLITTISSNEYSLSPLWKMMLKELSQLSQRSYERVTSITGIISFLVKYDFHFIINAMNELLLHKEDIFNENIKEINYSNILIYINTILQKTLKIMEQELDELGEEAWNAITIIDAAKLNDSPILPPKSPKIQGMTFAELGELKQQFGIRQNSKNFNSQLKPKFGPRVEMLQFVAPNHKDRFLKYLILQEFGKEIAILLTTNMFRTVKD